MSSVGRSSTDSSLLAPLAERLRDGGARPHLLLVEDSPSDRILLQELLEPWATAAAVSRLGEALELVETMRFDAALVDLNLPDASGLEAIERLRHARPELAIVVLTGEEPERAFEALGAGAQDFFSKDSLEPVALLRAIIFAMARREAEDGRLRLREGERLLALGQLAAGVAHEVNNPLSFVLANLEGLEETLGVIGDEPRQMLADAVTGTRRIARIVGDLQRYARAQDACPIDTRLDDVARSALNLLSSRVASATAEVSVALEEVPVVAAIEGRLVQVAANLLGNALDAVSDGQGTRVRVSTRHDDEGVSLVVEDDGPGIAEEDRDQVFTPFFTTKGHRGGMGLGLAVCAEVADQHAGELWIDDSELGGARIELRVPFDTGLVPPAVEEPPPVPVERLRLLFVDDEALVRRAYGRMLGKVFDVESVGSGPEALAKLEAGERYDLVLCDVEMPGMRGPEVVARIRDGFTDRAPRVALCSGGVFGAEPRVSADPDAVALLGKPFGADAVLRLLERMD